MGHEMSHHQFQKTSPAWRGVPLVFFPKEIKTTPGSWLCLLASLTLLRTSELEAKERPKPRNDYLDCYTGPKVKWEESHIRDGIYGTEMQVGFWALGVLFLLGMGWYGKTNELIFFAEICYSRKGLPRRFWGKSSFCNYIALVSWWAFLKWWWNRKQLSEKRWVLWRLGYSSSR